MQVMLVAYVGVFGVFKVTHHPLSHLQVVFGRCLAVLFQEFDCKGNVRSSPDHCIHQLTYNVAISGDVSKWCAVARVVNVSPRNWHICMLLQLVMSRSVSSLLMYAVWLTVMLLLGCVVMWSPTICVTLPALIAVKIKAIDHFVCSITYISPAINKSSTYNVIIHIHLLLVCCVNRHESFGHGSNPMSSMQFHMTACHK